MSDQLRDLLSRVADDAPTALPDPTLWRRARRARARNRALAVGAVAATVAVIATVIVQGQRLSSDPDPAPNPAEPRLLSVHGVVADGGLRLERDLAVGQATAAVTNDTDVFVVTADDGVYHRLRLPGYDPALHDGSLDGAERPGVALSPDGRRLAYAWHAPIPTDHPAWEESYRVPSGVRVLDLTTGAFAFEDEVPPFLPHHTIWTVELASHLRWSSDGRYVVYHNSFGVYHGDWTMEGSGVEVLDTTGQAGWVQGLADSLGRQMGNPVLGPHTPFVSPWGGAIVIGDRLFAWHPDGNATGPPMAIGDGWGSGAFATSRRALLGPLGVGDSLLDLDLQTRQQIELRVLDTQRWPEGATIELLGTTDPDAVIASVRRATDGEVADDADLVVFDLSRSGDEPVATVVGHVTDTSGSAFSFATDLVALAR
ncbi:MAG: hypothetical protein ABWZ91_09170 [Nocardioides sp.]